MYADFSFSLFRLPLDFSEFLEGENTRDYEWPSIVSITDELDSVILGF